MLDYKIQYLLDKREEYMSKVIYNYNNVIDVYGKASFSTPIYADMLFSFLSLSFLGGTQRLELYKKLIEILRKMGINTRIPSPSKGVSSFNTVFYGSAAPHLTPAGLILLTESNLKLEGDVALKYNPSAEVMYLAYPNSISGVNYIKDINNFEVSAGWTMRTETLTVNGQSVSYKVYESNNLTELTDYIITFNL